MATKTFKANNNKFVKDGDKANEIMNLFKSKNLKNLKFENLTYIKIGRKSFFLISGAKKSFNWS